MEQKGVQETTNIKEKVAQLERDLLKVKENWYLDVEVLKMRKLYHQQHSIKSSHLK